MDVALFRRRLTIEWRGTQQASARNTMRRARQSQS